MLPVSPSPKIGEYLFCALDVETTGLSADYHDIVEIGLIRFTLAEVLDRYETLVNPGRSIPREVTLIHGITDDMVKDSPAFGEIFDTVIDFMRDSILVIQNPGFDLSFLNRNNRVIERLPHLQMIDTVRLTRAAYPDLPNHRLGTLCSFLGVNQEQHHRAMADAYGCMEVFRRTMRDKDPEGEWTMGDLRFLHGNLIRPKHRRRDRRDRLTTF